MSKKIILLTIALGLGFTLVQYLLKITGELELHVLDIGQGDALVLQTPEGHTILIDGGPGTGVLEGLGEVLPFFDRTLDLLVLTHPHEDHVAGLVPVLDRFEVKGVLLSAPDYENQTYKAFLARVAEVKIPVYLAEAERDFEFGSVTLDVLYPFEPVSGKMENVNNASVVIRVVSGENEILLTGDAEQEVEAELLAAGAPVSADILKAGHHGSRTSSTPEFLEAVGAELMIISSGTGNDYGHPHEETLAKAEDLGMEVLRTDLEGTVSLIFSTLHFVPRVYWLRSILAPRLRSFSSRPS